MGSRKMWFSPIGFALLRGLVKGVLILLVAQWVLCDLLVWIPPEVAAQSRVLALLNTLPLLSLTGG